MSRANTSTVPCTRDASTFPPVSPRAVPPRSRCARIRCAWKATKCWSKYPAARAEPALPPTQGKASMTPEKTIEIVRRIERSAEAVRQPVASASHVSYSLYSDPEVLELEKERLFMKDWLLIG